MLRLLGYVTYFVIFVLICLSAADLLLGHFLHIGDREANRTYQPIFVSGHYYYGLKSKKSLEYRSGEGPTDAGYSPRGSFYVYEPKRVIHSPLDRFNWLFRNEFTRYSPNEMDRIIRDVPSAVRIYVIGGSGALGTNASSKKVVWHARLEQRLRNHFQYPEIYVFNAAVGAFVTTQERLVFELALLPRKPDVVIDLNGVNDIFLPITRGSRPGDPYQTGLRYSQFYNTSVLESLAQHSNLLRSLLHSTFVKTTLTDYTENILGDARQSALLGESIVNVYCHNMKQLLKRCRQESIECRVFLQPWRDMARHEAGEVVIGDKKLFIFLHKTYKQIADCLQQSSYQKSFIDLSHIFSSKSEIAHFADWCHLNDSGQEIMVSCMFPTVSKAVKRIIEKKKQTQ